MEQSEETQNDRKPPSRKYRWAGAISLMAVFVIAMLSFRWVMYYYVPVQSLAANIPDAAKVGNVPQAIEQCHELFQLWKKTDGSFKEMVQQDRALLYLPDRKFAEDKDLREGGMTSFSFPNLFLADTPLKNRSRFIRKCMFGKTRRSIRESVQRPMRPDFIWSAGRQGKSVSYRSSKCVCTSIRSVTPLPRCFLGWRNMILKDTGYPALS